MAGTPSRIQKIHTQCPVAQLIPVHGTKPSQRPVTLPPSLGWMTSSRLKQGVDGSSALRYLRCARGDVLEVLDLGSDFPSLQMGLAKSSAFHQVIGLGIKDPDLMAHFSQLVVEGTITFDFSQDAPVIQPGDLLLKHVILQRRPHKEGPKPPW